tara:strand:+ start:146 stop:499 length:354 start_codon:yes stop_codon:yes gene_type:complete
MQHTQGSWRFEIRNSEAMVTTCRNGKDMVVAGCLFDEEIDLELEEVEANARLIASAPEMLKTLIDLLEIMNDDHYKCDLDSDQECDLTDEGGWQVKHYNMRLAIQAIAKATGQKGGE